MEGFVVYWAFVCFVEASLYLVARRASDRGVIRRAKMLAAAALALAATPYVRVECLTIRYRTEVLPLVRRFVKEEGGDPRLLTIRVMGVQADTAEVYCIEGSAFGPGKGLGYMLTVPLGRRRLEAVRLATIVWSDQGSAEGNVFPPYWWGSML